ncbi:hypothetical protein [Marinobacter sp. ELB17]|uniref:hypothetical protein n=1 Tax=Marinobacter sp. ELB17 TaxID=270374 RepID=UPI0000F37FE4|nr:hypothetical protein [Marinobacter sp. ELB17]EBA00454.1 hypothetical protein MELB17_05022 [Marinobacter sp. ELB17]
MAQQNLTVMISTKLNRSHIFPGKSAYVLPCPAAFAKATQSAMVVNQKVISSLLY